MTMLNETLIRQLHQRNEMQENVQIDEKTGKPVPAFIEKLQRLESVTGATVQEPKSIQRAVTKFKTFNFERRTHTRYSMPLCHFDSFNLWLLKPTHLNRGRGIHVFRDLDSLIKLIK